MNRVISLRGFMKKKIIIGILIICLVVGSVLAVFFGIKKNDSTQELNRYDIHLKIEDDFKIVELYQEFTFNNYIKDGLANLSFNLYPNAYSKDAKNAAYSKRLERYGDIEIITVETADRDSYFGINERRNLLTVTFEKPLKLKEKITIKFEAALNIPICSLRFGTYKEVLNLCNFYPILAGYEGNDWRDDRFTKIGDPFFSEVADYNVSIECSEDMLIAHSGDLVAELNGNIKKTELTARKVRDFAIVASKRFKKISDKYKDTNIDYYYLTDKTAETSLAIAKDAIKVFSESFGNYPYNSYTIVETNFSHGGMEYPNLSMLSDTNSGSYKIDTIIHETAHQWFSCLVGSDSINNPWIDEGLTSFATNFYYILTGYKDKYDALRNLELANYNEYYQYIKRYEANFNGYMRKSVYSYNSDYEYSVIAYTKANLMYDAFYRSYGRYNTEKTIKLLVEKYAYKNITESQFIEIFSSYGNGKGILDSWLDGKIITF